MISTEIFETIKQKYGGVASWAVWEDVGVKPKSNMGHLTVFNLQKNPALLEVLKNNVVMVGCKIRSMPSTDSGTCRPLIPGDIGH